MKIVVILAGLIMLGALPARAGLSQAALDGAAAQPRPGAAIPLSLRFVDETGMPQTLGTALGGRPAVLVFADFTCRTLCGPVVEFTASGLERTGLAPGTDYRLLIVGLDPKDPLDDARRLKTRHVDAHSPLAAATKVLSGDMAAITAATTAAGYRAVYDADNDQFAHPAAAFVIDAGGRISRVLTPLALDGADLRLALVDAAHGRIGTLSDRIHLLCYGFDPATGVYTRAVTRWLAVAALTTIALLASGIGLMLRRSARRPAS